MISRKPVSSAADESISAVSPTTATGTYSSTVSNPYSPEDIRAPSPLSSPSRTDAASSEGFYDAPEVVPGTGPKIISGIPDYGGEKLTLGINRDPSAAPQTVLNTDPASLSQPLGSESSPPYSSINTDPKSGPQAVVPTESSRDKQVTITSAETIRPWWERKLVLGLFALVLFIIIGLAVGLGVGLTVGRSDGNNSGGSSNDGGSDDDDNQGSPE